MRTVKIAAEILPTRIGVVVISAALLTFCGGSTEGGENDGGGGGGKGGVGGIAAFSGHTSECIDNPCSGGPCGTCSGGSGGHGGVAGAPDAGDADAGADVGDADGGDTDASDGQAAAQSSAQWSAAPSHQRRACYAQGGYGPNPCLPADDALLSWLGDLPNDCQARVVAGPFVVYERKNRACCYSVDCDGRSRHFGSRVMSSKVNAFGANRD